jgi:hypothetical protein
VPAQVVQGSSAPAPGPLSADRMRPALLAIQDLPTGWSTDATASSGSGDGDMTGCPQMQTLAGLETTANTTVEVHYTKGIRGPFFGEGLVSMAEASARKLLTDLGDMASACPVVRFTSGGNGFDMHLNGLSFPNLGEDTLALRISGAVNGVTLSMDWILVRRGGLVVDVLYLCLNADVDSTQTESLTRKAMDKVRRALP